MRFDKKFFENAFSDWRNMSEDEWEQIVKISWNQV